MPASGRRSRWRAVLGLSPQGYYKRLKDPVSQWDWDDAHVIDVVPGIHADHPTLGYRFVADELADSASPRASKNGCGGFAQQQGFASHHRRRGKSGRPGPAVHDDLLATVDEKAG